MAGLIVRRIDRREAHRLLRGVARFAALTPERWDSLWENHGLVAFAAEARQSLRAFALAESHPQTVHVAHLGGRPDACWLLLERLVRLAGERDMSAVVPMAHPELQVLLEELGFLRVFEEDRGGGRNYVYRWNRTPPA
jgi:hypothetical protein